MPKAKKILPIYEYKTKVNGQTRYYIRPCINGVQTTKRTDDKGNMWLGKDGYNLALEELAKIRKEKHSISKNVTFGFLKEKYYEKIEKEIKRSSSDSYKSVIHNQITPYFDDNLNIKLIDTQKIIEWHNILDKKNLNVKYKNKINSVLSGILDVGIKYGVLQYNSAKMVGNFKETNSKCIANEEKIKYITYDEFEKFISVIDDQLWKTFFIFLYYTGCRKGEAMALNWNDIDFRKNIIRINKTINYKIRGSYEITDPKNHKNRNIQMNKILREQLLEYKNEVMKKEDFDNNWFVFGNKRYLPTTTIDRKKDEYFKLAKIKKITTHEFRHSHVSLLINEYLKTGQTDAGKFFVMVANRMGHTTGVMQETYMHLFPTIQDEIVDILNNLVPN